MTNTQTTPAANEARAGRSNQYAIRVWKPLLVFILFTLAITAGGYFVFQRYMEDIKNETQGELSGISELKIRQIDNWMAQRMGDAQALRNDPLFLAEVEHWLQQGGTAGEATLIERLTSLQQAYAAYGYTSISLLDDHAVLRLSSSADDAPSQEHEKGQVLESMRNGQSFLSDIHLGKRGTAEVLETDLVAPLITGKGAQSHAIGVVLFHIDPYRFLFPLIQHWPTSSPSAENLLVRREGDEVVFLNELRHRRNTPLAMRLPLSQQQLLATMAVLGQEGLVEGVDYRGVPVVGVLSKVTGTSWFMVSKIDKAEIDAPINHLANWMLVLMLALVGAGGGIAVFWRKKESRQYESELNYQRLAKHLDYLSKYANDIIMLLDCTGKIVSFNDRALEAYGYSTEELSSLNIDDLRAIDIPLTACERLRQIDQAGGALVFESTHIRRNGANFPVEASVRLVDIDGEKFYQAILRDITERKKAEEELTRQKNFIRQVIDSDPNLIFVKDACGRFLLANDAMAKSYGQTIEGIVGKCNSEFVDNPGQVAAYDSANREVLENRQQRVAIEMATLSDGKKHFLQTIRKPLEQDDGEVCVLTIAMDITELKELEEKLQKTNRALRLLGTCNATLVHTGEEGQLLAEICKLIVDAGGYKMAWVGMVEHDPEKTVRPVARYGSDEDYPDGASWADTEQGRDITGTAIRTGMTQVNQNFMTNPGMEHCREAALARGYQSNIALPLSSGAWTFGMLAIYSDTAEAFNTDEVILLEEIADNLAWGITALRMRTEHEQAVEKLRQSEEHFRFLTENSTDMIYLMSLSDGRYDYVSPSSEHLTGYTPEEFYDTPMLMQTIVHPDWHAYCQAQWGKLLGGEIPAYFEFQIIHKSGEIRWMHQRNVPIWSMDGNGTLISVQGVITNITERKRAEKTLHGQKTFMWQVIDTDPNQIFVKDANGRFLLVNQSAAAAHGSTPIEMIGKNLSEIDSSSAAAEEGLEADRKVIKDGREVSLIEPSTLPNGEQRWYLTIKNRLTMPDGRLSVLCIAVDITQQKLSEMNLAESYRKLQQLSLHLENVRADERARIALNLHDEMGATLVAIKMSVAWLASKLPVEVPQLSVEAARISELVSGGIHTMHQIVTQLRPNLLDDVGLAAAIRDYVNKFRQHSNIECILVLPDEEFALDADQSLTIFRILQESLNNVVKHAQAGRVNIHFSERGESLLMAVRDNGIGFATTLHKEQSFGLLGIRERALMVGGKARISSAPGKGTRVSVSIPYTGPSGA